MSTFSPDSIRRNRLTPIVVKMVHPSGNLTASFISNIVPYLANGSLGLTLGAAIANLRFGDCKHRRANNRYLGS